MLKVLITSLFITISQTPLFALADGLDDALSGIVVEPPQTRELGNIEVLEKYQNQNVTVEKIKETPKLEDGEDYQGSSMGFRITENTTEISYYYWVISQKRLKNPTFVLDSGDNNFPDKEIEMTTYIIMAGLDGMSQQGLVQTEIHQSKSQCSTGTALISYNGRVESLALEKSSHCE